MSVKENAYALGLKIINFLIHSEGHTNSKDSKAAKNATVNAKLIM